MVQGFWLKDANLLNGCGILKVTTVMMNGAG